MTKDIQLAACPFCHHSKAKITTKRRGNYRREGDNFQGLCNHCKARGPLVQDSPEKAAEAWNQQFAAADTVRMNWIEGQATDGLGWQARQSATGRGFRLHQGSEPGAVTAREAIDLAAAR